MILPGDIEIDLYRISEGEPIRWQGLSSGAVERAQGLAIIAGAVVVAAVTAPGAVEGLADLDRVARGLGSILDALTGLVSLSGAFVAAGLAWFGWRTVRTADRVAWAVTTKRLIRMVGGEADKARSWRKDDIVSVKRADTGKAASLAVTVRGGYRRGRRRNRTLVIIGPTDLDAAEQALAALEAS